MTTAEQKKQLRTLVRSTERTLSEEYRRSSSQTITQFVESMPEYQSARSVFCFVGTRREIDTTELLRDILSRGKRLCVPLCTGDGIMEPREISSLSQLSPGAYGILEPSGDSPLVPLNEVALSVIPCLSCDHQGRRLGQGGGYYDRLFSQYSGHTVMLCRERLMLAPIPTEPLDQIFPLVVTERGIFRNGVCQTI